MHKKIFIIILIFSLLSIGFGIALFGIWLMGHAFVLSDSPSYDPVPFIKPIPWLFWGGLIVLVVNLIWYYIASNKKTTPKIMPPQTTQ